MRAVWLVVSLVAVGFAGCVGPGVEDAPGMDGGVAPSGYRLDCSVASAWSEGCLALASPNDSPSKTEIDLAVNPTNPLNVVVSSKDIDPSASKCVWAIPQVSHDGGATWTTSVIGGSLPRAPTNPLAGWNCITDPIMVYDAEGTLYYSLQLYDHTLEGSDIPSVLPLGASIGSSIQTVVSRDGGLTWSSPIVLHAGDGTTTFHDYMRMAVNPKTGTVYTIWNQFNGIVVTPVLVGIPKGSTVANAPSYIPEMEGIGDAVMSGFTTGPDGTVYVILNSGGNGYFSTSTDDGLTFSTPTKFATHAPVPRMMKNNTYRSGSGYELVIDNSGGARDGWLYATFADYVGEDADINVIHSKDGGKTWSDAVQVNTDGWARGDQWMDRPYVDARGTLHILYLDKSRDPHNYGMDATWAHSTDGGATWHLAYLTQHAFDPSLGIHQDNAAPFIGDYNGIGGAGNVLYMGFPTTVTGRAEIAVAKVILPS